MIKTDDLCDIEIRYESTATPEKLREIILKSKFFEERKDLTNDGCFYPISEQPYLIRVVEPAKSNIAGIGSFVIVRGMELKTHDVFEIVNIVENIIKFAES